MQGPLNEAHYEALAAVHSRQHGGWDVINITDAEYCMERGLLRFIDGRHFELTHDGLAALRSQMD